MRKKIDKDNTQRFNVVRQTAYIHCDTTLIQLQIQLDTRLYNLDIIYSNLSQPRTHSSNPKTPYTLFSLNRQTEQYRFSATLLWTLFQRLHPLSLSVGFDRGICKQNQGRKQRYWNIWWIIVYLPWTSLYSNIGIYTALWWGSRVATS